MTSRGTEAGKDGEERTSMRTPEGELDRPRASKPGVVETTEA